MDVQSTPPRIEVDAILVAEGLGLAVEHFRSLMQDGHIRTLSERGVGADLGRYRFTFYYRKARLCVVTDNAGNLLERPSRQRPGAATD